MVNQKHDRLFGEVETGVLKSSCKMYLLGISFHNISLNVKPNITASRDMNNVQIRFGYIRNHNDILMSSGEDY